MADKSRHGRKAKARRKRLADKFSPAGIGTVEPIAERAALERREAGAPDARDDASPHDEAKPSWAEPVPPSGAGKATDSLGFFNGKLMEMTAGNVSAAGDFVAALLRATTLSEVAAIHADYLRGRLDALTVEGRELVLLAEKVAIDALPADAGPSPQASGTAVERPSRA